MSPAFQHFNVLRDNDFNVLRDDGFLNRERAANGQVRECQAALRRSARGRVRLMAA